MKSETYLKTFFVTLFLSACAFAQGFVYQGTTVVNGVGQPIAGASVAISTANPCGTSPTYTSCNGLPQGIYTGSTPPASLATLYTDVTVGTTTTNPLTTDSLGNWSVYVKTTGTYWATIYGPRLLTQVYPLGVGGVPINSSTEIGDLLRFGVNGDNAWDSVNAAQAYRSVVCFPDQTNGAVDCTSSAAGTSGTGVSAGSRATVNPTLTNGMGNTYSAAATASTNTLIGFYMGENGNNTLYPIMAWNRWSHKLQLGSLTNNRYWVGLGVWCGGACAPGAIGNNSLQILGTTGYAADVPNKTVLGYRYSNGTDTHWQCVSIVAGASSPTSTVVDTGITPDTTTIHTYEMATNLAGTSINCLIDGAVVGTISTNLPVPGTDGNTLVGLFFSGDNKNTNTAVSATWYRSEMSLK